MRSLKNKLDTFFVASCISEYDLICLTETWLTDSVSNSEFICTANYNVFRSDRKLVAISVTRGGGVLLAVKDHTSVQRIDLTSFSNICPSIDLVRCKLTLGYHVCLFL